ncbi:hypothetical protein FRACYDRAFT_237344 [Fragilariopsis cylindrus CCMP1102]|uniref:Uncharacterized protein n=1 Tax=Fragilariopsis cylindrus CCMP1102 TaxID=635003 RepID=A0A1E7FMN5_9STRA|nr:hypothetical protein FRACYDRAFT_237344 [Fragilariopsis cylindrus CCMP1102]|eukprot:OEU19053.1 hypothetical protein FRACYDRAFT_237344 [Fragilariopsis cylindrus CCMP1102]
MFGRRRCLSFGGASSSVLLVLFLLVFTISISTNPNSKFGVVYGFLLHRPRPPPHPMIPMMTIIPQQRQHKMTRCIVGGSQLLMRDEDEDEDEDNEIEETRTNTKITTNITTTLMKVQKRKLLLLRFVISSLSSSSLSIHDDDDGEDGNDDIIKTDTKNKEESAGRESVDNTNDTTSTSNNIQIIESIDFDDNFDDSSSSIDVIIFATHYPYLFDDPYINDWVRRYNSILHMSTNVCNDYCYYQLLNEGATIVLW